MNNSSLVTIIAAFQSGYPNRIIEKYKDRIFLTPEAAGVMGNIVGFIAGLASDHGRLLTGPPFSI